MRCLRRAFTLLALPLVAGAQSGRPVILVVHGRGQLGRDSASIRTDALHAIQAGLHDIGADVTPDERDVRLVWYADILDARAISDAPVRCGESVKQQQPNAVSMVAMFVGALVQAAVPQATGSDAMELRGLAGDLRYLSERDTRCAAEGRLSDALRRAHREHRPVILVSHSLGALVSWGELTSPAGSDTSLAGINSWITVGSPLGAGELRDLLFGEGTSPLALPRNVTAWHNVVSSSDPFAMKIGEIRGAGADVFTDSPHDDPHQLTSYLGDRATARLILGAWHTAVTM